MDQPNWRRRPLPTPGADATVLGRWEPLTPVDLTMSRNQLADAVRTAPADIGAIERLLLAFEELASNGLRHGSPPLLVEVTSFGHFWLLDVSDTAVDTPPTPAVGRDAADGGLGLYLIARLCGAYGWTVEHGAKHVWGRIDYTRPEAPATTPSAM